MNYKFIKSSEIETLQAELDLEREAIVEDFLLYCNALEEHPNKKAWTEYYQEALHQGKM